MAPTIVDIMQVKAVNTALAEFNRGVPTETKIIVGIGDSVETSGTVE